MTLAGLGVGGLMKGSRVQRVGGFTPKRKKIPQESETFRDRAGEDAPSVTTREEALKEGVPAASPDPRFENELLYEGYSEIHDYDNTVLKGNVDEKAVPMHELKLKDRELCPPQDSEESPIDPQEHRQGGSS
jgi:hypothetical protein